VERKLKTGEDAALLCEYFGEHEYEQLVDLAHQRQRRSVRGGPRVLILPGIMGSKLGTRRPFVDDVLWLDPLDIARGRIARLALPDGAAYEPLGVMLLAYLKLKLRLQIAGFDAEFRPFDWRKSIVALGRELATYLERQKGTLHVVAHSMGGLVMRAALPRLSADKLGQFVMLGTPNYGSFVPVQALRGQYTIVSRLAILDLVNDPVRWAKEVVQTFPGLYEMLPFPEKFAGVDLFEASAWPAGGPRPPAAQLKAARGVHQALAAADQRFFLVAGVGQRTTVGLEADESGFVYTQSNEGDGTVPLSMCLLPGATTYYVEEAHGSLANHGEVARATIDILHRGKTDALRDSWNRSRAGGAVRVAEAALRYEPFGGRGPKELAASERRNLVREVAAPGAQEIMPPAAGVSAGADERGAYHHRFENVVVTRRHEHALEINLALGSVTEMNARALTIGVFSGVEPGGAAGAVDEALGGAVKDFTARRMFAARVGEVFVLPTGRNRLFADSILFAGLGSFGSFSYEVLEFVSENVVRTFVRTNVEDFAVVLFGAASGQSVEGTLRAMFRGFLRGLRDADGDHTVRRISICELDVERYQRIKEELYRLASTSLFDDVRITLYESELPARPEPSSREERALVKKTPQTSYLYVTQEGRETVDPQGRAHSRSFVLRSSLLTPGGKATVLSGTLVVDPKRLDAALAPFRDVGSSRQWLEARGKDLAALLLPPDVQRGLWALQSYPLVIVHDAPAARVPWETLLLEDPEGGAGWFPAERAGTSRHYAATNLSVAKWLDRRRQDDVLDVLLVVNPTGDLDGTLEEAARLEQLSSENQAIRLTKLEESQATKARLLAEFGSGRYDVVHYAGHAFFDPEMPSRSGIVCHGDQVLSGADLARLSSLPALAFFNACEAARVRGRSRSTKKQAEARSATPRERIEENVGLAEAFLRGGVASYVGTYWPVGDSAAAAFCKAFYGLLLSGEPMGSAVQAGRAAAASKSDVDWANYVHYGAVDFALKVRGPPR
jgi:hypothetical protein